MRWSESHNETALCRAMGKRQAYTGQVSIVPVSMSVSSVSPLVSPLEKHWRQRLKELTEQATSDKLPAGAVYACLSLSRLAQQRRPIDTVAVKALMEELGWKYKPNRTRPHFLRLKLAVPMVVLKRDLSETEEQMP